MKRMKCFVCGACCFWCPNTELFELGEPTLDCSECYHNSGLCEDCLLEHSKDCPIEKEKEKCYNNTNED